MSELSRYHAIRKIADGGSAEVFLAEQRGAADFKRLVVLKRIRPALAADETFRLMLMDEARLAMSLRHSNIVEVFDVGEANGRFFLVLELVDGWTLHQVLKRAKAAGLPLPPSLAVYVTAEVCRALAYAHERTKEGVPLGIVHRDVCPNNVLVSMHAEVKLADFGIAQGGERLVQTQSGQIRGKPSYMSPEQTRGEKLDARSDLFSVGTVLFQLLTGVLPFPGPIDEKLLKAISETDAPSPDTIVPGLPEELCRVVKKAMARKREDRYASAQELLSALERVQRTALEAAGRSQLEHYLRTLSAKDGETAISRQTMPPAPPADEPEWISLSGEQSIVMDQTATQRALPAFVEPSKPARSGGPPLWLVVAGTALVTSGLGWWLRQSRAPEPAPPAPAVSAPAPAPVVLAPPAPPPVAAVEDAGEESPPPPSATEAEVVAIEAEPPSITPEEQPDASTPAPVAEPVKAAPPSRSGTANLKLSARVVQPQKAGSMVAVLFESEPAGVAIKVDKRELGRTPTVLRFRSGFTFDVWFEAEGQKPLRQWLMLTEREGKPVRVTLRDPVD